MKNGNVLGLDSLLLNNTIWGDVSQTKLTAGQVLCFTLICNLIWSLVSSRWHSGCPLEAPAFSLSSFPTLCISERSRLHFCVQHLPQLDPAISFGQARGSCQLLHVVSSILVPAWQRHTAGSPAHPQGTVPPPGPCSWCALYTLHCRSWARR